VKWETCPVGAFFLPQVALLSRERLSLFDEGEEKKMRRLLLLIFVLRLLIDLGDDGFPGKARFVSPVSPSAGSVVSSLPYDVGQIDSWCELPLREARGIPNPYQDPRLTCNIRQILRKISSCHISSAGGLPLKFALLCHSVLPHFSDFC
jgi:hypothetical protein